ncbi:ATP-binding protein [Streptomyces europaeiscabiei]|uniref:ATP-binding protein n=1 Tax=Streptomyces europaeiscabiei TaxID=146819 RepID=UPI002E170EAD
MERDVERLNSEIENVEKWLVIAGNSLLTLKDKTSPQFLLDTLPHAAGEKYSKTSTHRCFAALVDLLLFLEERDEDLQDETVNQQAEKLKKKAAKKTIEIFRDYYSKFASGRADDQSQFRGDRDRHSVFRDSHLLLAVARMKVARKLLLATGLNARDREYLNAWTDARFEKRARDISVENLSKVIEKSERAGQEHDFISLYAVRAADAIFSVYAAKDSQRVIAKEKSFSSRVRQKLLAQMGFYCSGITSHFDPAEFAFSATLLDRLDSQDHGQLGHRALEILREKQADDGSWPSSRKVLLPGHDLPQGTGEQQLRVASFDVALALTNLLIRELNREPRSRDDIDLLCAILGDCFEHVKDTFYSLGTTQGWSTDSSGALSYVESGATAVVLTFLDRYRFALLRKRQSMILGQYHGVTQRRDKFFWPDLSPSLGRPQEQIRFERDISDPTSTMSLQDKIDKFFLNPVRNSPVRRPADRSLLLTGPPGTRKTSLIRAFADALKWPLLILSPPDFLRDGLEGFENRAAEIFEDLMQLRRAVVLLDECEDFFRRRPTTEKSMSVSERTMGAFITSGMLPRIQALHDQGWVVFALATNVTVSDLDAAAIRPARFDFQQEMPNPTIEAQLQYVDREEKVKLSGSEKARLKSVLNNWDETTKPATSEADPVQKSYRYISFDILSKLMKFMKDNPGCSSDALDRKIKKLTTEGPPQLESE